MADPKATEVDFGSVLQAEMAQVNELQEAAQVAAEDFAAGRRDDIESVLFAARKADTAFKMLLQVRNKVQFDWRKERVTQAVMRIELLRSYEQISSGKKNTTQQVLFSHVRDGVFRLRIEETD